MVSYLNCRFLIQGVQYASVLDVYTVADTNGVDVATQYGTEPDTAITSHFYISDDSSVIC